MVQTLNRDDAQAFVDKVDKVCSHSPILQHCPCSLQLNPQALDLPNLEPWLWKKCLSTLCKMCGHQALLPRSLQIPICYNRLGFPKYSGGFADVWKGEHQGLQVAVKVLRVYSTSDFNKIINVGCLFNIPHVINRSIVTQRFCKEAMTWKALSHPNVLPLLGVIMAEKHFALVSEWMTNGSINEFIVANRTANRFKLVGFGFLLSLLHSEHYLICTAPRCC